MASALDLYRVQKLHAPLFHSGSRPGTMMATSLPTPEPAPAGGGRDRAVPAAPGGRADARGRRLHAPQPGSTADPSAGVRRELGTTGPLRPATPARLQ